LSWVEFLINNDGTPTYRRSKIYSKIESKKILLIPKLDFLLKHVGRQKSTSIMPRVKVGEFYKNQKMSTHKK
jgi:hypothetical protein